MSVLEKKLLLKTETGVSSPHAGFVAHNLWEIVRDIRVYPVECHFIQMHPCVNTKFFADA